MFVVINIIFFFLLKLENGNYRERDLLWFPNYKVAKGLLFKKNMQSDSLLIITYILPSYLEIQ